MIPNAYIQAWSAKAPWPDARQIEQDLIISRALCDLFNAPMLKDKIAFRGGTAINKLLFKQSLRYSEDIDLVQTQVEPIGTTVDAIRATLSWLGKCSLIADLPGNYLNWFAREGFPKGEIGRLLALMQEMDHNGLRSLLDPLRSRQA